MMESASKLGLSVYLPTWRDEPLGQPPSWREMRELAQQAEAIGTTAVFVGDHSGFERVTGPRTEFWDCWTLLPALAEATSKIALGPMVATPLLRHPIALARMASTLDEVSDGRMILALGSAGPIERAWRTLGIGTERLYSRFEEAIQIIAPLVRTGGVDFQGRYYVARDAVLGPTGPQGHSIPIWIGVKGPRMTRLAARWADAVNFGLPIASPDDARSLVSQFDAVCRELGRDPSTVQKTGTVMLNVADSGAGSGTTWDDALTGHPAELAAQLHAIHLAPINHLTCVIDLGDESGPRRTYPLLTSAQLAHLARVIDALRTLEAAV